MSEPTELLPCPFHEHDEYHPPEATSYNEEFLARNNLTPSWWVECDVCGARGPQESTPEEAEKTWNLRWIKIV